MKNIIDSSEKLKLTIGAVGRYIYIYVKVLSIYPNINILQK